MALGGSPAEFWRQTPRSFVAIMEGMARAASRNVDLATVTAWQTAVFGLNGYAGKLKGKSLSDFLSSTRSADAQKSKHAQAIHFFHSLQARGVPVEITRH